MEKPLQRNPFNEPLEPISCPISCSRRREFKSVWFSFNNTHYWRRLLWRSCDSRLQETSWRLRLPWETVPLRAFTRVLPSISVDRCWWIQLSDWRHRLYLDVSTKCANISLWAIYNYYWITLKAIFSLCSVIKLNCKCMLVTVTLTNPIYVYKS